MSAPVQVSEGAELPPLTEAELAEIEARGLRDQDLGLRITCAHAEHQARAERQDLRDAAETAAGRLGYDVYRLATDLRRAQKRIAELEAQVAATAAAHREDQRRADELAGVPG